MKPTVNTPRFVRQSIEKTKNKAFKVAQRRASESLGIKASKTHGPVPSIELYQREDCPFSHAVRNRLTRLGLDFVAHNVPLHSALKLDQLIQASGKNQVPFLIDHTSGIKLYDSSAIIAYLNQAYSQPANTLFTRLTHRVDSQIRSRADQIAWTLKTPLHRASDISNEFGSALKSMRASFDYLRERVEFVMKKSRVAAAPTQSRTSSIRAHVESVVEAA